MSPWLSVIVLHLFWFSFIVIGGAMLFAWWRLQANHHSSAFFDFLAATHPLIVMLIATGCGMALLAPILIPAYLLHWPLMTLEIFYLVALGASVVWFVCYWRESLRWLIRAWHRRSRSGFAWFVVVAAVLLADAIVSTKVGGPMIADAFVHMAKINLLVSGGKFTLADPLIGNGVIESRYHINLILSLNALGASLFHLSAINAWKYSIAFWRALIWVSMFSLSWLFVAKKVRRRWSYIVLMVVPVLYSTTFFCADYPDRAVYAWVVLLLIGLKLLLEKRSVFLLMVAAGLIAFTHPLMSVIVIGFLVPLTLILALLRLVKQKHLLAIVSSMVVLLVSVIYTDSFPNRMSASVKNLVLQLQLRHYGPFTLAVTINADKHHWWVWWPFLGAGIVGCIYLIQRARSKAVKVTLLLLFLYYVLIVYNPILLAVIGGHIPPWVINRFQEMNVFRLITSIIGVLVIAEWIISRARKKWLLPVALSLVTAGLFWYGSPALRNYLSLNSGFNQDYSEYMTLQSLTPQLQGQRVYSDVFFNQLMLPVVIRTNIFNFPDQTASPMANMDERWNCVNNHLALTLKTTDLQAAGISRIIALDGLDPAFAKLAETNPDLKIIKKAGPYTVYSVPVASSINRNDVCFIAYGQ